MLSVVGPLRIVHLALSVNHVSALSREVESRCFNGDSSVKVMSYLSHVTESGVKS